MPAILHASQGRTTTQSDAWSDTGLSLVLPATSDDWLVFYSANARAEAAAAFASEVAVMQGATRRAYHASAGVFATGGVGESGGNSMAGFARIDRANGDTVRVQARASVAQAGAGVASSGAKQLVAVPLDGYTEGTDFGFVELGSGDDAVVTSVVAADTMTASVLDFSAPAGADLVGWAAGEFVADTTAAEFRAQLTNGRTGQLCGFDLLAGERNGFWGAFRIDTAPASVSLSLEVSREAAGGGLARPRLVWLNRATMADAVLVFNSAGVQQDAAGAVLHPATATLTSSASARQWFVGVDYPKQVTNWCFEDLDLDGVPQGVNRGSGVQVTGLAVGGDHVFAGWGAVVDQAASAADILARVQLSKISGAGSGRIGTGRGEAVGASTVEGLAMVAIAFEPDAAPQAVAVDGEGESDGGFIVLDLVADALAIEGEGTGEGTVTIAQDVVAQAVTVDGEGDGEGTVSLEQAQPVTADGEGTGEATVAITEAQAQAVSVPGEGTGEATVVLAVEHPIVVDGEGAGEGTVLLDGIVTVAITGPVAAVNTTRPYRTESRGRMGQPWYVNPEDEGQTLSERIVYPELVEHGKTTEPQAPADLSSVQVVALQYWDRVGQAWVGIAGTGSVEQVVDDGQTWYELRFTPAAGALEAMTAVTGRTSVPRRWSLDMTGGGDLHVPSSGFDTIAVNELPS